MNCDLFRNRMADFVTHRLSGDEANEVNEHLIDCEGCRRFQTEVSQLYGIDFADEIPIPTTGCPDFSQQQKTSVWRRRVAAATLTAAAAILVFAWLTNRETKDQDTLIVEPTDLAALASIELKLPDFPVKYPATGWVTDHAAAAKLASYTGKPLLTTYWFTPCPRCVKVKKEYKSPKGDPLFTNYINYKHEFLNRAPAELGKFPTKYKLFYMMPTVVVSMDEERSLPLFEISEVEQIKTFSRQWQQEHNNSKTHLPTDEFARCVKVFQAIPDHLRVFAYEELLKELEGIIELDDRFRSKFISDAKAVTMDLSLQLRAQMKTDQPPKEEDVLRLQRLRKHLGKTSLGRELDQILRR